MLQPSIGLTAGFALAANAFMIPSTMSAPELSSDDTTAAGWRSLDITRLIDPSRHHRIVKLACKDCAFPVDGEKDVWTTDIDNSLVLDLSTSTDGKAVILNGERIFPLDHALQLKAPQVASDVSEKLLAESPEKFTTTPRRLSFGMASSAIEAADGTDAQLINLDLRVFKIDDAHKDLDLLSIRLLRDEDGKVSFASIDTVPNTPAFHSGYRTHDSDGLFQIRPSAPKPHAKNPVCNSGASFLCDWVAAVEAKIASVRQGMSHHGSQGDRHGRPCPGRKGMNGVHGVPVKGGVPKFMAWKYGKPHPDAGVEEFRDMMMHHDMDGHSPHHHSHLGHHGHGHAQSSFDWLLIGARFFILNILAPLLIGVAAGMIAGALGILVGTVIAWAWIKFVRGGRRGSEQSVAVVVVDDEDLACGDVEEKTALMESAGEELENPPPVYAEKE